MQASALLRLLQLASPALPVGGFNFSQALEYTVEAQWIQTEADALNWITGLLRYAIGTLDAPILLRLHGAWARADSTDAGLWSRQLIASRESAELRMEDRHLGRSLAKILSELKLEGASHWMTSPDASFACLFALAASRWSISAEETLWAYLWVWCENQVISAVKLIPLGQTAGQRLLDQLIGEIPHVAQSAARIEDQDIGVSSPMQGLASIKHERQYSRLFRS